MNAIDFPPTSISTASTSNAQNGAIKGDVESANTLSPNLSPASGREEFSPLPLAGEGGPKGRERAFVKPPHQFESHPAQKVAYENHKLHKRLCRQVGQAIVHFNMIEEGDKVMVCLSGGKDSYALLDILLTLRARAPIHFDIVAVNLDQKQPNFPAEVLPNYLTQLGVPFHIETQDTYSVVKRVVPEGKTTCALCSRMRRGILYRVADELGATKIALGHHRDDILETFFMNMFFAAKIKGMPTKLQSDSGKHIVIRPLAYVKEQDTARYAAIKNFPIIPCDLCGSQENLQRKHIKALMREWEKKFPGRVENIFSALSTVIPSHLMDRALFDFTDLKVDGTTQTDGDIAFDEEPCSSPSDTINLNSLISNYSP